MQKMQTPWSEIAPRLTAAVRASPLKLPALAEAANVDYHAVYRIHRDGTRNRGKNALALCKYFGIALETEIMISEQELAAAVIGSWDGTPEHARLLIELVQCAGPFRVMERQSGEVRGEDT